MSLILIAVGFLVLDIRIRMQQKEIDRLRAWLASLGQEVFDLENKP